MDYIPNTDADREAMLKVVGVESVADLFRDVPEQFRFPKLDLPPALTEMEMLQELQALADENDDLNHLACFLGAGAYNHFVPKVVDSIISRGEFFTAYTPYQPEISQGTLQAHFEYQSMITALTGMEVSNVSHYDGATAVAEAVIMALQVGRDKRCNVILSPTLNPQYREVVHTYTQGMSITTVGENAPLGDLNALADLVDKNAACVIVQNPDFLGRLYMPSEMQALADKVHAAGALLIVAVDPISLGLFTPPGEYGADVACGEGQPMGNALSFGGPYVGFFSMKMGEVRKSAGRIVGQTVDVDDERGLRAHAQHPRAAHPPREGVEQHLHQPGAERARRGDLHGRDGQARAEEGRGAVLPQGALRGDADRQARRVRGQERRPVLQGVRRPVPAAGGRDQRAAAGRVGHPGRLRPGPGLPRAQGPHAGLRDRDEQPGRDRGAGRGAGRHRVAHAG